MCKQGFKVINMQYKINLLWLFKCVFVNNLLLSIQGITLHVNFMDELTICRLYFRLQECITLDWEVNLVKTRT